MLGEALPAALMGVWGTSPTHLWVVGADSGTGPQLLFYDGEAWLAQSGPSRGDLWAIRGVGAAVYAVGSGGRVWRGTEVGDFVEDVVDPVVTLYGIWGADESHIWAVGGDPDAAGSAARIFSFDGYTWSEAPLPVEASAAAALFTVWGRSVDEVYAAGSDGVLVRWDGVSWATVFSGGDPWYALAGDASNLYLAGGGVGAMLYRQTDGVWFDERPANALPIYGLDTLGGRSVAVGRGGARWTRGGTGWDPETSSLPPSEALFDVWIDSSGGVWMVGGSVLTRPLDQGVLIYDGPAAPPRLPTGDEPAY